MTYNQKNNTAHMAKIRRLKLSMILGYALVVLTAVTIVSTLAVNKTDAVLKNKVSTMASSLNVQMMLNMDSYLARMETIGTLVFATESACTYDATAQGMDEFEALNTEKEISDALYSLCIMENFVDFSIIYSNNHPIGKLSNGTVDLFGDNLYSELSARILRQRTNDGWFAGYQNDFHRIYYVKRVHENAILLLSFYASELEDVFDNPENMEDMTVCLTEQNYNVLYSSEEEQIGQPLPEEVYQRVKGRSSVTVMDDAYLITINACGDNWNVICSIPTPIILQEKNEMRIFIYAVGLAAAALAILLGTLLSIQLTNPVNTMVSHLDDKAHIDQLTGIFNKRSFEDYTENALRSALPLEHHALILLDVDNFKGVNDTLGHAYGDQVLANIGKILRETFTKDDYLGRIGGDEFCIFLNASVSLSDNPMRYIEQKCEMLCEAFHNNYTGADGGYKISASIGVALFPNHGKTFSTMYQCADEALYISKQRGKDTYTIYREAVEVKE